MYSSRNGTWQDINSSSCEEAHSPSKLNWIYFSLSGIKFSLWPQRPAGRLAGGPADATYLLFQPPAFAHVRHLLVCLMASSKCCYLHILSTS